MSKAKIKKEKIMEFLREFSDKYGYPPTVREIANAVGLKSTASVHTYLSSLEEDGCIKRNPFNSRAIEIISNKETWMKDEPFSNLSDPEREHPDTVDLPIVGQVAAGEPILAVENIEDYFPIPSGYAPHGTLFMLKVKGDSMIEAGILDGDMIMVKKQETADNGDMIVALIDDSATVKTFYKKQDKIVLQPENSSMEPIIVDTVTILGKVFGVYRFFK